MIGGTVVKVIQLPARIWVNCEEDRSTSQCAIYVERNANSMRIKPGDSVWWQGGFARWTPYENRKPEGSGQKSGKDYDIEIRKIGFSGVSHPPAMSQPT